MPYYVIEKKETFSLADLKSKGHLDNDSILLVKVDSVLESAQLREQIKEDAGAVQKDLYVSARWVAFWTILVYLAFYSFFLFCDDRSVLGFWISLGVYGLISVCSNLSFRKYFKDKFHFGIALSYLFPHIVIPYLVLTRNINTEMS